MRHIRATEKFVSAVADGPRNAVCPLKSYQLLHKTQLPQCDVACYDERTGGAKSRVWDKVP